MFSRMKRGGETFELLILWVYIIGCCALAPTGEGICPIPIFPRGWPVVVLDKKESLLTYTYDSTIVVNMNESFNLAKDKQKASLTGEHEPKMARSILRNVEIARGM